MRKITQLACNAFINGRDFTLGNTHVHHDGETSRMYLHGNLIAESVPGCDDESRVLRVTLAGWPTPTTRERVNGLCESLGYGRPFHQRAHVQFRDDHEVSAHEWLIM